jgi:16S rRNA (cytosine967-C5)-methyltransferase
MPHAKTKTARKIAVAVLNKTDPVRDYLGPVLNELLEQTDQKQRATDLVFGTIRNRAAIDMVISRLAECPVERIQAKLLNIIRIAAYELIYSPETAEHAIVNEAVQTARDVFGKKQTGFINAVLREITRHITNRQVPLQQGDIQKTLPKTLSAGCEFDMEILPLPEKSPADYFSLAFSLPKWLVEQWLENFGLEKTKQICFAGNRRPSLYIRPNILKTTAQQLAEKLHQAEIDCRLVDDTMIKVQSPAAITELPGFAQGLFSVQDLTASKVAPALQPKPTSQILDLCAAPGTKTTHLAELTADKAKIIATDIDEQRLEKVKENTARLGITAVTTIAYANLEKTADQMGLFDCVLLDVPCSNTGVMAKRTEVRHRIKQNSTAQLAQTQNRLLRTAAEMTNKNGKICYSTCSIQQEENQDVIKSFLMQHTDFKLLFEQLILPSAEDFDHDGGYIAVLEHISQ